MFPSLFSDHHRNFLIPFSHASSIFLVANGNCCASLILLFRLFLLFVSLLLLIPPSLKYYSFLDEAEIGRLRKKKAELLLAFVRVIAVSRRVTFPRSGVSYGNLNKPLKAESTPKHSRSLDTRVVRHRDYSVYSFSATLSNCKILNDSYHTNEVPEGDVSSNVFFHPPIVMTPISLFYPLSKLSCASMSAWRNFCPPADEIR